MKFPEVLYVGKGNELEISTEDSEEVDRDPRGLVLMWEPPEPRARYIMGLDPSEGITGWNRGTRVEGDHKIDNGAIEIFKVDGVKESLWLVDPEGNRTPDIDPVTKRQRVRYRDLQVCEFAAPMDAVEIARVANILGRVYAGDSEDQCELIWEGWPGCGMLTTQELLRIGYGNLWHWEYIADVVEETQRLGWRSTRESMKLLWYRTRRHLLGDSAIIRSKWLLAEFANAEIDLDKMRARAAYGFHDDRFVAASLSFWGGHKWTYDPDRTWEDVSESSPEIDYQRRAPILGEYESFQDWKSRATEDWLD